MKKPPRWANGQIESFSCDEKSSMLTIGGGGIGLAKNNDKKPIRGSYVPPFSDYELYTFLQNSPPAKLLSGKKATNSISLG